MLTEHLWAYAERQDTFTFLRAPDEENSLTLPSRASRCRLHTQSRTTSGVRRRRVSGRHVIPAHHLSQATAICHLKRFTRPPRPSLSRLSFHTWPPTTRPALKALLTDTAHFTLVMLPEATIKVPRAGRRLAGIEISLHSSSRSADALFRRRHT